METFEIIFCDHCDLEAETMGVTDRGTVEFLCLECYSDTTTLRSDEVLT